jgi:hypothetical protein
MLDWIKIGLAVGVVAVVGGWWTHYGYLKKEVGQLENTIVVLKQKHQLREDEFAAAVKEWQFQVETQRKALEFRAKEKEAIIKKHRRELKELFKPTVVQKEEIKNELQKVSPNDVVVAPAYFRVLYDLSATGVAKAPAGTREFLVSGNPKGDVAAPETFEAAAFTQVTTDNNINCVENSILHNKLIDVIEELEARNANAGRPDGQVKKDGGNGSTRAVGPQ